MQIQKNIYHYKQVMIDYAVYVLNKNDNKKLIITNKNNIH